MLHQRHILLGVTGGIAAYKACELTRLLIRQRAQVQVVMTKAATHFVAPLTFEALTGRPAAVELFDVANGGIGHLDLVRDLDLMVIAPASANCLGKLTAGIADDLLTTSALALGCPLLLCPAMNPKMYVHPAVQENLAKLQQRGVLILEPEIGEMAHPLEAPGKGRLPEPAMILEAICRLLPPNGELNGVRVIVTAGPTREAIDPVRVLSNLSSGKMGFALAEEARRRGAEVTLISGPVSQPPPLGVDIRPVESTAQMLAAVQLEFPASRVLVMAAAPADFQPIQAQPHKIKKINSQTEISLQLRPTPDVLRSISQNKGDRLLIGFALETESGIESAQRKLQEKHLDLIVLNHPHASGEAGIGKDQIQATLIDAQGGTQPFATTSKMEFAKVIWDWVGERLKCNHLG